MAGIRRLTTTNDIIDQLGGTKAFARLIDREQQHVTNYRSTGRFPSDTYLIVIAELEKLGLAAPPSLWKIREPKKTRAAA